MEGLTQVEQGVGDSKAQRPQEGVGLVCQDSRHTGRDVAYNKF